MWYDTLSNMISGIKCISIAYIKDSELCYLKNYPFCSKERRKHACTVQYFYSCGAVIKMNTNYRRIQVQPNLRSYLLSSVGALSSPRHQENYSSIHLIYKATHMYSRLRLGLILQSSFLPNSLQSNRKMSSFCAHAISLLFSISTFLWWLLPW